MRGRYIASCAITHVEVSHDGVKPIHSAQRKSYVAVIDFSTEATLSSSNNTDVFMVSYVNTVLQGKPIVRRRQAGDDSAPPPNIPLGKQPVTQHPRCELKSVDQLVCSKDNNMVRSYTRAK